MGNFSPESVQRFLYYILHNDLNFILCFINLFCAILLQFLISLNIFFSAFRLEENFMKHLKPGQTTLTLNEFKKMMPSKNEFFVRRVYEIFDIDGDGQLSLAEFLDKMYQYADSSNEINKVLLLFQVYDIDGMHK